MNNSQPCALITGAAHRIGAAITRKLHNKGYRVIIHYRGSDTAAATLTNELNQQRPNSAAMLQADLTSHTDVQRLSTEATQIWQRLDLLVNNASSFYPTPIGQAFEQDWNTLIDSNLKGPFFLSQALAKALQQQQGCIVNIIDIHSDKPMTGHCIYSIAKAGLAMMTKSLAKELAPSVRVNGVSPGAILWPEAGQGGEPKESILNKIPLQQTGSADDIARTVLFLADEAPYISGQIIAVDGGRSLNM